MVIIRGRLTPEVGAIVQRALEAASDRLFHEAAQTLEGDRVSDEVTPAQRRADALGLLAECALSAGLDRGTAGDRYQVVLHADATALQSAGERVGDSSTDSDAGPAVIELNDGATNVSAETSRRIACDASLVLLRHAADGSVLDVNRKTRTIPPAIRRALLARDGGCQFPGCTARRCDGHHIRHWADGGATRLDNLMLLCRRHHRAVHEGGFTIRRRTDGRPVFYRPDGTRVEIAPATRYDGRDFYPRKIGDGPRIAEGVTTDHREMPAHTTDTQFDLGWAIDVLRDAPSIRPLEAGASSLRGAPSQPASARGLSARAARGESSPPVRAANGGGHYEALTGSRRPSQQPRARISSS